MDIGQELVAPEASSVWLSLRLGAAAKAEQVEGVHLIALGQHREVVAPMVRGGSKTVNQQNSRSLLGITSGDAMNGAAAKSPRR